MTKTFGKRSPPPAAAPRHILASAAAPPAADAARRPPSKPPVASLRASQPADFSATPPQPEAQTQASRNREAARGAVFKELLDVVDLKELARMPNEKARSEVTEVVRLLLAQGTNFLDLSEQEGLIAEVTNDVLGLGPLEPLLLRDDIADIMVCGPHKVYIEVDGRLQLTDVKFRDETQLINVCRRIVSSVGRRVDESSPICDARLADGSRVAIVCAPIAVDGTSLTIRRFKKDRLSLNDLVHIGSISRSGARLLEIISAASCNVLVSGGTGSGKTTLLNILTRYIDPSESIITCEDAVELQLQQPNVRRWETRPPNLEGAGAITMAELVKAALRHRPNRIIIGEVRSKEAFDLLQAMNTGHDGSAGTVHANSPRDAISRFESMIAMGGFNLPAKQVREQIISSLDVIVQASRMRDGSRKVTQIAEVIGLDGDMPILQDLMLFEHQGEDAAGRIIGRHRMTGIRPHMFDKARFAALDRDLMLAMQDQIRD